MTLTLGGAAKEVKGEGKEEEKEGAETVEGEEGGEGQGEKEGKEGKEEGEVAEDGKTNPAGYVIILHLYLECRLCHRKGYF